MSTADIDDRLGSRSQLASLIENNEELRRYLEDAVNLVPIRTFFIPYGAGMNTKGDRIYISHDLDLTLQGTDISGALVRHETFEWALREYADIGVDYLTDPTGHRLANRAEHDYIESILGEDGWQRYVDFIDPQVIEDERQDFDDKAIPRDLALYPYNDGQQFDLRQASYNAASTREWEALTNAGTGSDNRGVQEPG